MFKIVDMALFHLNYIKTTNNLNEKAIKSHISQYFPVFPIFANILSISQDGNSR